MPPRPSLRQTVPGQIALRQTRASDWFQSSAGACLLDSETAAIGRAVAERPGQPWLWLGPVTVDLELPGRGLHLQAVRGGWHGEIRCGLPLPLANESLATVIVQHVQGTGDQAAGLLSECARVLVPGGRLWLFALNPLAPYRWRWLGAGLSSAEPMLWRRQLRKASLTPDPVSQGIGPRWRIEASPELQHGPGLRAAYLLCAEKRLIPMTAIRNRAPLRIGSGVPAA